ncbi:MAG: hypothetical protein AB1586_10430 [Pseudomonadota bacterium]
MTQALLIQIPAPTIRRRPAMTGLWQRLLRPLRDLVMAPIDRLALAADVGHVLDARTVRRPRERAAFSLRRIGLCAGFKNLKHLT